VIVLDVSGLPQGAIDHRAPIWWGNTLLLFIESTMFALLIATLLYLRQNAPVWPTTEPSLGWATLNLAIMLLSCVPMYWADQAAIAMDRAGVIRWTGVALLMSLGMIVLRFFEFHALHVRWDTNAYAAITWTLLGLHLMHLVIVAAEGGLTWLWVDKRGLDTGHALDVRCSVIYWFWVMAMGVVVYLFVFVGPHLG